MSCCERMRDLPSHGCRSKKRPQLIRSAKWIWLCFFGCLLVLASPARGASGASDDDSYTHSIYQLVQAHKDALVRLTAPAEATAKALIAGGSFYLAGDKGWIAEGDGRAGGLVMARPLSQSAPQPMPGTKSPAVTPAPGTWLPATSRAVKGDAVWLAYSPATYEEEAKTAKELEGRGCLVLMFGPKLADGPPHVSNWIDSLTPASADANLTLMGNILSFWTLTAEVTASTARQGKTLAFYESDSVEGAMVRNALYAGLSFHTGIPAMAPVRAGVLSTQYLDFVQKMLHEIHDSEMGKIREAGQELSRHASGGNPAVLMLVGHMMPSAVDHQSKLFQYMTFPAERKNLKDKLPARGYFVFIGYVGVYLDLWAQVRGADAKAVWFASPLPTAVNFSQWGDLVIDEHWKIGDCAVQVPGYDVCILPPSGIAQLYLYEMMIRAAGVHPAS
jgi:uncharacterized phosphosugar-binding protein